ncbi:HPP family protein [Variovorax sp. HJSM1_2]|uniref:CBS domain-containing protein n=1 Tax=Variovorax sp. HJSM1_2 TaxID=3366263 RepID=UPI003BD71908
MFSVYGVTGRVYTGSAEQLRYIEQVTALARLRRIEPNDQDLPRDPDRFLLPQGTPPAAQDALAQPPAPPPMLDTARNAVSAYMKTSQPDTPRQPLDRVDQLMTQPAVTVSMDMSLEDASKLLARKHLGQVPVVDKDEHLCGLLLRADLFRPHRVSAAIASAETDADAAAPTPAAPAEDAEVSTPADWDVLMAQPVSSLMWTPVPSVSGDTDIRRVARALLDTALPGLPVVDDRGYVIGFVSRSDILRAVAGDPPLDVWG